MRVSYKNISSRAFILFGKIMYIYYKGISAELDSRRVVSRVSSYLRLADHTHTHTVSVGCALLYVLFFYTRDARIMIRENQISQQTYN